MAGKDLLIKNNVTAIGICGMLVIPSSTRSKILQMIKNFLCLHYDSLVPKTKHKKLS